jgi:hypothetical protein
VLARTPSSFNDPWVRVAFNRSGALPAELRREQGSPTTQGIAMAISFKDGFYDSSALSRKEPEPPKPPVEPKEEPRGDGGVPVRLVPVNGSDSPVVANYAALQPGYGMAYLDFGFLEPSVLLAVQQLIATGSKDRPEVINARLATRVAVGYDVLYTLYGQIGQVLASLQSNEAQA